MDREYITDESKTFAVREEYVGERWPRYYINRQAEDGNRYLFASMGQDKCNSLFLCELLNDNIGKFLAYEEEYYAEDESLD